MTLAQIDPEVFEATKKIEFLIVLIGVILGLSIGRLVNFIGDFLNHWRLGKPSLTHGLFLFSVFIYQVYYWWDLWALRSEIVSKQGEITFIMFNVMMLIPLCLFCATAILCPKKLDFPEDENGEKLSMKKQFDEHCGPFYFFWVILCGVGIFQGMYIRGEEVMDPQILTRIVAGVFLFIGMVLRSPSLNTFLAIVMLLVLIAFIATPLWEDYLLQLRAAE